MADSQNSVNNGTVNASFVARRNVDGAGTVCFVGAAHQDTTNPASTGVLIAQSTAASGADAFMNCTLASTRSWGWGIDASDSAALKETTFPAGSTDPSTGTLTRKVTVGGVQTMPLQPAFLAYKSAPTANATGDGTLISPIIYDTELFDVQGNYDNATGIFTAPVTGYYSFSASVSLSNLIAAHVDGFFQFVTSAANQTCFAIIISPGKVFQSSASSTLWSSSNIFRLAAGDTMQVSVQVTGSTKTVTVGGASSTVYFRGALLF